MNLKDSAVPFLLGLLTSACLFMASQLYLPSLYHKAPAKGPCDCCCGNGCDCAPGQCKCPHCTCLPGKCKYVPDTGSLPK